VTSYFRLVKEKSRNRVIGAAEGRNRMKTGEVTMPCERKQGTAGKREHRCRVERTLQEDEIT
jgi:hypothetical protein